MPHRQRQRSKRTMNELTYSERLAEVPSAIDRMIDTGPKVQRAHERRLSGPSYAHVWRSAMRVLG